MLLVFSACHIWTLFTSHLHMYMSSAYYLSICVLCAYFLQWSLISSFLTNNANVIYMSSLLLFIDPYMLYTHIHIISYVSFTFLIQPITCNLVSTYCLHTHMSSAHHLYVICTAPMLTMGSSADDI